MSVDATKIKVGDKVRLRNGWVHTVTEVGLQNDLTHSVEVCWLGGGFAYRYYTRDGLYWADKQDGLDIVEIIPAETLIDASKIKVGDKIRLRNGEIHTVTDFTTQACFIYPLLIDFPGRSEGYTLNGLLWLNERHDGDIVEIIPAETSEEEPNKDEMTLRDQFAMAALSALLQGASTKAAEESIGKDAYFFADKMMQARKENN